MEDNINLSNIDMFKNLIINNVISQFVEGQTEQEQFKKILLVFNKHGISSDTALKILFDFAKVLGNED